MTQNDGLGQLDDGEAFRACAGLGEDHCCRLEAVVQCERDEKNRRLPFPANRESELLRRHAKRQREARGGL